MLALQFGIILFEKFLRFITRTVPNINWVHDREYFYL